MLVLTLRLVSIYTDRTTDRGNVTTLALALLSTKMKINPTRIDLYRDARLRLILRLVVINDEEELAR